MRQKPFGGFVRGLFAFLFELLDFQLIDKVSEYAGFFLGKLGPDFKFHRLAGGFHSTDFEFGVACFHLPQFHAGLLVEGSLDAQLLARGGVLVQGD